MKKLRNLIFKFFVLLKKPKTNLVKPAIKCELRIFLKSHLLSKNVKTKIWIFKHKTCSASYSIQGFKDLTALILLVFKQMQYL